MRRTITSEQLFSQMERLNAVFGKFGTADELMRATVAYREALNDLDAEAVEGAVGMALKLEPRFPYPAKLREHAKSWISANRIDIGMGPKRQAPEGAICAVCGAPARWAWVEGKTALDGEERMVQRCIAPCDPTRHPVGGWYVPFPANFVAWVEDEETRAQPARLGRAAL